MRNRLAVVASLIFSSVLVVGSLGTRLAWAARPPVQLPAAVSDVEAGNQSVFIYLPAISVPNLDLTITGVEVNQGVQHENNSVPLVADRLTMARVYVANSAGKALNNVVVQVTATRGGAPLADAGIVTGTLLAAPARSNLSSSFNVVLPAAWLSGDVQLVATVDPNNVIAESNEGNNSLPAPVRFNPVPAINIVLFPINYTDTPTGNFYPGRMVDPAREFMLKTFPVSAINTSFRPAIDFSGDLSQEADWTRLLDQLLSIKNADGAPRATRYLGLIPTTNADGNTYQSTLDGLAYGSEDGVALSSDNAPTTVAHEIGHTYDLPHAPCGNPDDPDPAYPYPDASIGDFGLDISGLRLWSPTAPDNTRDIMSYCEPMWFSDYNYKKILTALTTPSAPNQSTDHALNAANPTRLLIRFTINSAGQAHLKPIYTFSSKQPVTLSPTGDYTIELLDSRGQVLVAYPAQLSQVYDLPTAAARSLNVVVPAPATAVSQVRVQHRGVVLAQRRLAPDTSRQTRLQKSPAGWTMQFAADTAKLVRYTTDAGTTWITLAVDARSDAMAMSQLPAHAQVEVSYGDGTSPESLLALH